MAFPYQKLTYLVVHHGVIADTNVIRAFDGDANFTIVERYVVVRDTVGRVAAPADPFCILVSNVADCVTVR